MGHYVNFNEGLDHVVIVGVLFAGEVFYLDRVTVVDSANLCLVDLDALSFENDEVVPADSGNFLGFVDLGL